MIQLFASCVLADEVRSNIFRNACVGVKGAHDVGKSGLWKERVGDGGRERMMEGKRE